MARPSRIDLDAWHMSHALQLAARGEGSVEPNPMVGCVIAHGAEIVGQGWHRKFGEPHAEIEALRVAGERAAGATLVVSLEPCCHHGKTPPCTQAVIRAGVKRVVVAQLDPFPAVSGHGVQELIAAGIEVKTGVLEAQAKALNAPYLKLLTGQPWVMAKWAMSLDGRIATRTGDSKWISGPESRARAHDLRARVDAIVVGSGTAAVDDPRLTARTPEGATRDSARRALRVVVDSQATLSPKSRLAATAKEAGVLVAVSAAADPARCRALEAAGCQLLCCRGATHEERQAELLAHLGQARCTNVLVEGGARLLGSLFAANQVDEAHVFVAAKVVGGDGLPPLSGAGCELVEKALQLSMPTWERLGDDLYVHGRVRRG